MKKRAIIEQGASITSLGTLQETTQSLLDGCSALQPAPCYDIPVAHAPFSDLRLREIDNAFSLLKDQIDLIDVKKGRLLFIYAAAKGDIRALEPFRSTSANSHSLPSPLLSEQAALAARIFGINPSHTIVISNACASGAVAVSVATLLLEQEVFGSAVVAGFDVISHFVTSGFHSFGALSPSGARPFDKSRDGLSLGDGAACAVLRYNDPHPGDVFIAGTAQSNDANHRTGPSRTGDGLLYAAANALRNADCATNTIGAIKCHGTATVYNDGMEAKAISALFSTTPVPPCFSIKGAIGHTSGAGSLIELLLASEFLSEMKIPPTANFTTPDPEALIPVSGKKTSFTLPSILCLSAGFGGLNAAVLLQEHRP